MKSMRRDLYRIFAVFALPCSLQAAGYYHVQTPGTACHATWPEMSRNLTYDRVAIVNAREGEATLDNLVLVSCPLSDDMRKNDDRLHRIYVTVGSFTPLSTTCWVDDRFRSYAFPISGIGQFDESISASELPSPAIGRVFSLSCLLFPGQELVSYGRVYYSP